MNIFVLDENPIKAAESHCDIHVNKMLLETCQLLSNARHYHGNDGPYRLSHPHHPCSVWVCESIENYDWLFQMAKALAVEYELRFERIHLCTDVLMSRLQNPVGEQKSLTKFALVMPDQHKKFKSAVACYRDYYCHKEAKFKRNKMTWTNREQPEWYRRVDG